MSLKFITNDYLNYYKFYCIFKNLLLTRIIKCCKLIKNKKATKKLKKNWKLYSSIISTFGMVLIISLAFVTLFLPVGGWKLLAFTTNGNVEVEFNGRLENVANLKELANPTFNSIISASNSSNVNWQIGDIKLVGSTEIPLVIVMEVKNIDSNDVKVCFFKNQEIENLRFVYEFKKNNDIVDSFDIDLAENDICEITVKTFIVDLGVSIPTTAVNFGMELNQI